MSYQNHMHIHIPNSRGHTPKSISPTQGATLRALRADCRSFLQSKQTTTTTKTCHNPPSQRDCIEQHNNTIRYIPHLMGAIPPQFGTIAVIPTGSSKQCTPLKRALGPTILWAICSFRPTHRYLVLGLSFEGGIFKEQQTTFV